MALADLLGELQATFPAGHTTGTFDAAQVLQGEYVALFTRLGVSGTLQLSSPGGWVSDGTSLTLQGTSSTSILGVSNPTSFFQFSPQGNDWLLVLDITLPQSWAFPQSFPMLSQGVYESLQLTSDPAALVIASGAGVDPHRQLSGAAMPVVAGINFLGTFATNSSALAQVAWLVDDGVEPTITGPIGFDATSGAVDMNLSMTTGRVPHLFGSSGPEVDLTLSLYSGLNPAVAQYECGVRFDATISFNAADDLLLSALLRESAQPILELSISGSALAFPSLATIATYFGADNGIVAALPPDLSSTSMLQVDSILFGVGLQSKALEYAMLSVSVLPGHTWAILPGVIALSEITLLFSIFQPFGTTPAAAFTFTGLFTLGNTVPILIEAELPGEILSGQLDPTQPEPSLVPLVQHLFGFTNDLPEELVISRIDFRADIPNSQYSAELRIDGHWAFDFGHDGEVVFEDLDLALVYDGGASATLHAKFAVDTDNQFDVEFDISAANTKFIGSWTDVDSPITYRSLAIALGMYGLPNLPDGLDLALSAATFEFDSSGPSFSFAIETALYTGDDPTAGSTTSAALIAGKNAAGTDWGFVFGMVVGLHEQLDLTDIPLVGDLVPAGDDVISLRDVRIVAATTTLPVYVTNDQLATLVGSVVNSGLVLTIDLAIGASITESISVRFGGSDDGTAADLPPSSQAVSPPSSSPAALDAAPKAVTLPGAGAGPPTMAQPGQQATWIDVQRSFGPVHINRVGFAITPAKEVAVLLDAEASLGGLSIGLTGLEAAMPIRAPFTPTFDLAGLAVAFDAAAFHIGGALAKVPASTPVEYTGELMLTVGSFGASAFGSYTTVAGSPSLFAFVFIDAPLGGPPAFFVTGLAGGFGYNRSLKLPTVADVGTYPLVQGAMGTLDADQTQTQLNSYIAPEQNEDWFAAGVRFTSFEMVKSFALLTVSFGPNVEIALMGECTVTIPVSTQSNPQDPVAEADLLLLVDVQVTNGVVAASAQLSPSSYVLSRSAQLTGGFAFYLWFGRSPYAGDFVVTLGGYNPYFTPPSYYPQVPQLGLNWQVSSELTVKGGLYFALTPSVIMAGGVLSATWQSGDIQAWFDARADFLIRFKPFVYQVDVAISIGLSVRVNLLVTSFTVTVHAGVDLTLWGPPFGGTARIDLSVVSFTMAFGSDGPPNPQVDWGEFRSSFLPPAHSGHVSTAPHSLAAAGVTTPTSTDSIITIGAPTGIVSSFKQGAATAWSVSAGTFQLTVATAIPSTAATVTPATTVTSTPAWTTALGVGPLGAGAGALASSLTVVIERDGVSDPDRWTATAVLGSVPSGLWLNTSNAMQPAGTVPNCLLGLTLVPAPPSGENTLPVPIVELLDVDPPVRGYAWSTATVPQGDSFDQSQAMSELQHTLVDARVAATRSDILSALSAQGASTATHADVGGFATNAPNLLFAPPALRLLGEVPDVS